MRSDGARVPGRVMPFRYLGSVVLGAVWAAQAWGGPQGLTVVIATALLVASVVMSVVLLVPINSRVARWSDGELPPDWKKQIGRWDRLHHARVGIIITAFVLLVTAGVAG